MERNAKNKWSRDDDDDDDDDDGSSRFSFWNHVLAMVLPSVSAGA